MRGVLRDPQVAVDRVDRRRHEQRRLLVATEVLEPGEAVPEADGVDRARLEQLLGVAWSVVYLTTFGPMFLTAQSTTSFIWSGSL